MDDQLSAVSAEAFRSYLDARGWAPVATWRGAFIWEQDRDGSGQLLLPSDWRGPGAEELLERAVRDLAGVEDRSTAEILTELTTPFLETLSVRTTPQTPSGTTPLDAGMKALRGIHELWKIGARRAEKGARPRYFGTSSAEVLGFLGQVELLTTKPGSYIFTTRISKETEIPRQESLFGEKPEEGRPSFSRLDAVKALRTEIAGAHRVAEKLVAKRDMGDLTSHDVSSETCKALGDLGGNQHNQAVEFVFLPGGSGQASGGNVKFNGEMVRQVFRFGNQLEKVARTGPGVIEGRVEQLDRHFRVKIAGTLNTEDGSAETSIWVVVSNPNYNRATNAHSHGRTVRARGEIRFEGGKFELHAEAEELEIVNG